MKKELSPELRALLAGLLSLLVVIGWSMLYKTQPQKPAPAPQTSPAPNAPPPAAPVPPPAGGAPAAARPAPAGTPTRAAAQEQTIVVENGLYRVELWNRGGVIRSWQLKNYLDDSKPPHVLDLVHPEGARQVGGWPFALALDDAQLEAAANSALYASSVGGTTLQAPAEVQFEWSDGHLAVTKRLKFDRSYVVTVETSIMQDGKPLTAGLAWRGGFGDTTVYMPAERVQIFSSASGKLQTLPWKKLGAPNQPSQRQRVAGLDYAGIEDQYFVAAFIPPRTGALLLDHWKIDRDTQIDGKPAKEPVAEIAAGGATSGPLALRVFVGPKDYDVLKSQSPPLTDLIQFGYLEFISYPLFLLLEWIHGYVANYGWAIILMTVLINMVLFPLKVKTWRSMQRMQKVAPEIKVIQEKYKKYSMRDPRRQQMNEEMMAIYRREGINPMGGCLPMLLQMPIWFGLYRMLGVTIELRHAPWLGWIRDLSAKDPYYILPVLMGVTMYAMQKMTPSTTTDPAQQRMLNLMPLMFGGMFIIVPVSSGLVLYILTSNIVGMLQQWYLNRTSPVVANPPRGRNGKKK